MIDKLGSSKTLHLYFDEIERYLLGVYCWGLFDYLIVCDSARRYRAPMGEP